MKSPSGQEGLQMRENVIKWGWINWGLSVSYVYPQTNEFDLNIVGTDVLGGPKTMKFDFVYGYAQTLATKGFRQF